jgi:uncharacterized protein YjbJ (UPF0337 family)
MAQRADIAGPLSACQARPGSRHLSMPGRKAAVGRQHMNRDQIEGKWKQLTGKVKSQWGDLTDDEIAQAEGDRDQLAGKIQAKYGGSKEEIRRRLDEMDD